MYISREVEKEILKGVSGFPVLTITGPRQSGKTTMIKHLFPGKTCISFENPDNYEIARTALYRLFPFSISELGSHNEPDIERALYKGYYPRIWDMDLSPGKVYADYFETYICRQSSGK